MGFEIQIFDMNNMRRFMQLAEQNQNAIQRVRELTEKAITNGTEYLALEHSLVTEQQRRYWDAIIHFSKEIGKALDGEQ